MSSDEDSLDSLREYVKQFISSPKYDEGYERGLNWPDKWESHGKPGGPWIKSDYVPWSEGNPGWRYNKKSLQENRDWCRGWEDGHNEKIKIRTLKDKSNV